MQLPVVSLFMTQVESGARNDLEIHSLLELEEFPISFYLPSC